MALDTTVKLFAANSGTANLQTCVGIALTSSALNQKVLYAVEDPTFTHGLTGVVSGDVIYGSATAGRLTATYADLTSLTPDAAINVVGVATSATQMNLRIVKGGTHT